MEERRRRGGCWRGEGEENCSAPELHFSSRFLGAGRKSAGLLQALFWFWGASVLIVLSVLSVLSVLNLLEYKKSA